MLIAIDAEPANRNIRTGVEAAVFNLIKEIIKLDADHPVRRYVLFTKDKLRSDWPPLPANFKHQQLSWPSQYFWAHLRLGLALRNLKPDLTFIPGNVIPFFVSSPVVTVIHDIVFVEHPGLHTGRTLAAHDFALRRALQKAALIITPTQATKNVIYRYFPQVAKPLQVIPWGVDREIFRTEISNRDQEILYKFGLHAHKYFLYIGRLEAKKNIPTLIEVFREFKKSAPDIKLVLVGTAPEPIDLTGATQLGYQPSWVTSVLYRHALAFLFPSNYEGFGLPVLEAQSAGCPVICSDLAVLREVGGQGALYIDPQNKLALKEAMARVLASSPLRDSLRQDGFANARNYTWQKTAAEVIKVFAAAASKMV